MKNLLLFEDFNEVLERNNKKATHLSGFSFYALYLKS